jgi:predicted RNA binding protein YcfA (HicA-like mRNA interferase family)
MADSKIINALQGENWSQENEKGSRRNRKEADGNARVMG